MKHESSKDEFTWNRRISSVAGILGAAWVVSRIIYSLGYYSAPSKRIPGAIGSNLTLAALAVYNIYSSLKLLKLF